MTDFPYRSALIVGAGSGIGASIARRLIDQGVAVGIAARDIDRLELLAKNIGAIPLQVDASQQDSVRSLFDQVDLQLDGAEVVIYNAASSLRGTLSALDPTEVRRAFAVTAYGGFLVAQQAAARMSAWGKGALLFTGHSASLRGSAAATPMAMGKFALRGLAQSASRELEPYGVHVAHIAIDAFVTPAPVDSDQPASAGRGECSADLVASAFIDVLRQPRGAWTSEVQLAPVTHARPPLHLVKTS